MPSISPSVDAPDAKKFKKKEESITRMTIIKGRIMPRNNRIRLKVRRKRGFIGYS